MTENKEPSQIDLTEYGVPKTLADKCVMTIRDCAAQLGITIEDAKVMRPPVNLDPRLYDLGWTAKKISVVDDPPGVEVEPFTMGGRLNWDQEEPPSTEEVLLQLRRSCMFSMTVAIMPERSFVYQALEATRFSQNSVLLGMFIHDCAMYMQNNPPKDKNYHFPSVAKAQGFIADQLKKASKQSLVAIHERLSGMYQEKRQ